MEVKINIYSSFYSKILKRHKNPNDIYIQVSRSLFLPKKGIDNKSMMSMIDISYGKNLGMYEATLEEYEQRIRGEEYKEILNELAETFTKKFILESMNFSEKELSEIEEDLKDLQNAKSEFENLTVEERKRQFESFTETEKESLYLYGLTEKQVENISNWKPCLTYNFFILCFEDLESKYTEKDEKKYPDCKAGTFKTCHRTILAKVLNEMYGLNITEL